MDLPINKTSVFNTALPVADSNLISAISPSKSPGVLRLYICVSIAGVLSVRRTSGGVTVNETLNSGAPLVAGASYMFPIAWKDGESLNFQLSTPSLGSSNLADGTGTADGAPVTLAMGNNTITVTGAGTFTVTLGTGLTGTATSGTATVVGSPQALVAGANVVDTGVTTGTFTLNVNGGTLNKLQADEVWNG